MNGLIRNFFGFISIKPDKFREVLDKMSKKLKNENMLNKQCKKLNKVLFVEYY